MAGGHEVASADVEGGALRDVAVHVDDADAVGGTPKVLAVLGRLAHHGLVMAGVGRSDDEQTQQDDGGDAEPVLDEFHYSSSFLMYSTRPPTSGT